MLSGDKNPRVRKRFARPAKAVPNTVVAACLNDKTAATGFPSPKSWRQAKPLSFDTDWQGKKPDPHRQTKVRLLWTSEFLYLKFVARYRLITVFENADVNGRRDKLWDRDVAEVFLQPDPSHLRCYKEFEISPNGFWIDLEIVNGVLQHLQSGLQRRVGIDKPKKTWTAELSIPMKSLAQHFDPASVWRVNFFRVEGPAEPRFYSSWQPTNTPQPNFHVPERFGFLTFEPMPHAKLRKKNISRSKK
ncbi:MAG TPA: carbohydrate-binding family 9-like protein [Methylomirabilota bacterium]|nr:carbohydrate-binding family 9-like protein [Methylomirabilota bacterium]